MVSTKVQPSLIEIVQQCSISLVICFHLSYFIRLLKTVPVTKSPGSAMYHSSEKNSQWKITKKLVPIFTIRIINFLRKFSKAFLFT